MLRKENETAEEVRGPYGLSLLSAPADPTVDFIFVHGLRGGSRKTWSKTPDPAHFWPKEWLPRDHDFKHVRIHSFGYNSDWVERRDSVLDIHDFGRSLLAAIREAPMIRRSTDVCSLTPSNEVRGL